MLSRLVPTLPMGPSLPSKATKPAAADLESTVTKTSEAFESDKPATRTLRKIGFGQCGLVLESFASTMALKLCRPGFDDGLWTDCLAHGRVSEAFRKVSWETNAGIDVLVPDVYAFVAKEDAAWWKAATASIPRHQDFLIPCRTLITERIPPPSKATRDLLVDLYCPPADQAAARLSDTNRDCLARVYLGRKSPAVMSTNFTLRNFNFHIDQLRHLQHPVAEYACALAEALAVIHWVANVTAYDVEFVLGGKRSAVHKDRLVPFEHPEGPESSSPHSLLSDLEAIPDRFARRAECAEDASEAELQLWVLDFNLCGMWEEGVGREHPEELVNCLVEAFFENDPYYPLPCAEDEQDQQLWHTFRDAYLVKAGEVLQDRDARLHELPRRFVTACEERERLMLESGRGHGARDRKQ